MSGENASVERRADAFDVLVTLTRALTETEVALDAALQCVTDAALDLFRAQHSSLRVVDESAEVLLSGARSGAGTDRAPVRFRKGEGVIGWVIARGERVRIDDVAEDPRFVARTGQGYEIRSLLAVPMFSAGKVIGCLALSASTERYFTPGDEVVLQLLANCAVPPIERARLERLAITDPLTGALNRGQLEATLDTTMARARDGGYSLAYLSLDLDHFKRVNDDHGHQAGDRVLRVFAQRVRSVVRAGDVFIRRGGEEFVLVMPHADEEVAIAVAERVRRSLNAHPVQLGDGVAVEQHVSIGVAVWDGAETPAELDARADAALYVAKREGRDRYSLAPPSQAPEV